MHNIANLLKRFLIMVSIFLLGGGYSEESHTQAGVDDIWLTMYK